MLEVVLGIPALSFSLLKIDIYFEMLNVTFKSVVRIITFSKHECTMMAWQSKCKKRLTKEISGRTNILCNFKQLLPGRQ